MTGLIFLHRVVRCLVRRYVTAEQRKSEDFNITEDDINEVGIQIKLLVLVRSYVTILLQLQVRQDIRSFRYELINILKMNDMKTPNMKSDDAGVIGRKSKDLVITLGNKS